MKNVAGISYLSRRDSTLGSAARDPYSPVDRSDGSVWPFRRARVSLSKSNDRATATLAPPGQDGGSRRLPARTFSTAERQRDSGHFQDGSSCGGCWAETAG